MKVTLEQIEDLDLYLKRMDLARIKSVLSYSSGTYYIDVDKEWMVFCRNIDRGELEIKDPSIEPIVVDLIRKSSGIREKEKEAQRASAVSVFIEIFKEKLDI